MHKEIEEALQELLTNISEKYDVDIDDIWEIIKHDMWLINGSVKIQ